METKFHIFKFNNVLKEVWKFYLYFNTGFYRKQEQINKWKTKIWINSAFLIDAFGFSLLSRNCIL